MWRTSDGSRTLSGAERTLFVEAAGTLADELDMQFEGDDYPVGIDAFDRLHPLQRICQLAAVTRALIESRVPEAALTAVNEATAYAVYRYLVVMIAFEVDMQLRDMKIDEPTYWRNLTLAAWRQVRGGGWAGR